MRIREIQHGLLVTALLLVSLAVLARSDTFLASSPRAAFVGRNNVVFVWQESPAAVAVTLRGGATLAAEEEGSDEEEEESEDEEEDEEEDEDDSFDASLAAAAVKSSQKAKTKAASSKASTIKKTMSAKLSKPKKKSSLLKFLRVPYILRACLNPFTVASMIKHFWVSLLKLDYPPKVSECGA